MAPTAGRLNDKFYSVVSWPAAAGSDPWQKLLSMSFVSYCCVWTGNDNSPVSEWFDPWVANVKLHKARGRNFLFCTMPDGSIGKGQSLEKQWLDKGGIAYHMVSYTEALRWEALQETV